MIVIGTPKIGSWDETNKTDHKPERHGIRVDSLSVRFKIIRRRQELSSLSSRIDQIIYMCGKVSQSSQLFTSLLNSINFSNKKSNLS